MEQTLFEIYRQCNEHLRASDNKRDQVIAFYLILISLFFNSIAKIEELKVPVAILIFGLGQIIAMILITYRKWHIVHINTAIVIQYLAANDVAPTEDNIIEAWSKLIQGGSYAVKYQQNTRKKYSTLSTERLTSLVFWFITFTPMYLVRSDVWMLGFHIAYVVFMSIISELILNHELRDGYHESWLLRTYIPKSVKE